MDEDGDDLALDVALDRVHVVRDFVRSARKVAERYRLELLALVWYEDGIGAIGDMFCTKIDKAWEDRDGAIEGRERGG